MAQLTTKEFDNLIATLASHFGFGKFHDRLIQTRALVSRKRPASVQTLANQLYQLTAGLRREHPARYAVEILWQESLGNRVNEEKNKELGAIAGRINACLTEQREVMAEKQAELLAALHEYYQTQRAAVGDQAAYLEMLMRAVPVVGQILRERWAEWQQPAAPQAAAAPQPEVQEEPASEQDGVRVVTECWRALNTPRDVDKLASFYAEDAVVEDVGLQVQAQGNKEFARMAEQFANAFDVVTWVKNAYAGQDNTVVIEWEWHGTHRGEIFGIPATGKEVELRGASLITLKDDKIVFERDYWDRSALLRQLGQLTPAETVRV